MQAKLFSQATQAQFKQGVGRCETCLRLLLEIKTQHNTFCSPEHAQSICSVTSYCKCDGLHAGTCEDQYQEPYLDIALSLQRHVHNPTVCSTTCV